MTSANSSFFSRMARGNEPLLPLHTNNQHTPRSSNEYDLRDLSPRPSSPLLSPDIKQDMDGYEDDSRASRNFKDRKGKAKAVAYAEPLLEYPPMSVVDRMRLQREARAAARGRIHQKCDVVDMRGHPRNLPSWTPPFTSHFRDESDDALRREHSRSRRTHRAPSQNNQDYTSSSMSFVGSVLLGRSPKTSDRATAVETDITFRTIQRRERQIQEELQLLLDAQGAAIERQISGDTATAGGDGSSQASTPQGSTSRRSSASQSPLRFRTDLYERNQAPAVIPVRQPKPKPLSLRQVRNSIARTMSMLADLKAEETQYILEARQARLAAIAKANRLSNQHKTIASELKTMETDKDDPLRREIHSMDSEYKTVCLNIEEFEEKLRLLKLRKSQLERRMEEARSERESGLSGYRGALKDTERSIGDMMKRPGVRVLELDSDFDSGSHADEADRKNSTETEDSSQEASADKARWTEGRVTGKEFMHLRPERRTLAMAKEWWEGETATLTRRQAAVDRELEALHEGIEVWSDVVAQISGYETRLAAVISSFMDAAGFEDATTHLDKAESHSQTQRKHDEKLFRAQYSDLLRTIQEIEGYLGHAESKGYNLLIAAIGGELTGFKEGERMLLETMHSHGIEYKDLVDTTTMNDEVEGGSEQRTTTTKSGLIDLQDREHHDEPVQLEQQPDGDITGSVIRNWGGSVLDEQQQSEPTTKDAQQVKLRGRDSSRTSSKVSSPLKRSLHPEETARSSNDDGGLQHSQQQHHHHRDESDNEVPPGLLSEAHHAETSDEEDGHDHRSSTNEVPAEFLSMHHSEENKKVSTAADPSSGRGKDHEREEEHADHNELPLDLMTESRREDVD
ncbi:hypothetical protein PG994_007162 [Apiospora phragmitis]|uniref:Cep57 centrosome microtubule-binding domain-containing protein n=1 Tax=Apiospora phragmitis TaxID=2905665 RepID=A0ABR1V013_9PEZI